MLLIFSIYWCSFRWYFSAVSCTLLWRNETWARRAFSLRPHLSFSIRDSCSVDALLSCSASFSVRSESKQLWFSCAMSSWGNGSPHPLWQIPTFLLIKIWSSFIGESISTELKTVSHSSSLHRFGQSAHMTCRQTLYNFEKLFKLSKCYYCLPNMCKIYNYRCLLFVNHLCRNTMSKSIKPGPSRKEACGERLVKHTSSHSKISASPTCTFKRIQTFVMATAEKIILRQPLQNTRVQRRWMIFIVSYGFTT